MSSSILMRLVGRERATVRPTTPARSRPTADGAAGAADPGSTAAPGGTGTSGGGGPAPARAVARTATVSVVVPFLDAAATIEACVDSILRAVDRHGGGEVILIDNGSTDGSLDLVRARYGGRVAVHRIPGVRIGALRNFGARVATGEVLSFVDADCVLAEDYFERALDVLASGRASATGCSYHLPDRPHWVEAVWHELHRRGDDGYVAYLNAGNFVCERGAFEAVGGFDEELVTGEDAELCQRLWSSGYRIWESRAVAAVHLGNPKSLRAFFRKQHWHALGMFGTFRNDRLDKPLLMTFAHLGAVVLGAALVAAAPASPPAYAALVGLPFCVPTAAVLFRVRRNRTVPNLPRAVLLYFLYFGARAWALLGIARGALRFSGRVARGRRGGAGR